MSWNVSTESIVVLEFKRYRSRETSKFGWDTPYQLNDSEPKVIPFGITHSHLW
jgi:hypothetical protein